MDDCNNCMCTESGNSCTKMLCNFALPFEMSGLRTGADSQCLDGEGTSREIGENWMEDCNNCMCTESGNSCTKMLCNFDLPFEMSGLSQAQTRSAWTEKEDQGRSE